jgi:hypothetical protein
MNSKMIIGFEGTPIMVRVVAHKTDSELVVLKASNPIAGKVLCELLNVNPITEFKGAAYFLTMVSQAAFFGKLGNLAEITGEKVHKVATAVLAQWDASQPKLEKDDEDDALVGDENEHQYPAPKAEQLAANAITALQVGADKCAECGTKDNIHWGFCPHNKH